MSRLKYWLFDEDYGWLYGIYVFLYSLIYRNWQRFIHKRGYHKIRHGWCHWCGYPRRENVLNQTKDEREQ